MYVLEYVHVYYVRTYVRTTRVHVLYVLYVPYVRSHTYTDKCMYTHVVGDTSMYTDKCTYSGKHRNKNKQVR